MATFTDPINANNRAELIITLVTQDVSGNRSKIRRTLQNRKTAGDGAWTNTGYGWALSGGGANESGSYTYDYTEYSVKKIYEDEIWVTHTADGTREVSFAASVSMGGPLFGTGTPSGTVTLPTIPRATQPSVDGPLVLQLDGGSIVISMPRASSSFRHRVRYTFGDRSGTLATDVGTSFTWTTTTSLLSELPDATTGLGTILVDTYASSGGDLIGTKTVPFRINVGSEIKPSIGGLTLSEAVPAVASAVGAYVQGQSRLDYAITGAAGAFGSTITDFKLAVAGQTRTGASGTTAVIAASGTMNAVATVTDSRGRTATRTVSISVLPWTQPSITLLKVQRCLPDGTLDDNGTSLKFTVEAAVSSLMNGAQRNTLTWLARTRQKGTTVWSSTAPVTPAGIVISGTFVISTYSELLAWDARFEVVDLFTTSAAQTVVSVGAVALDIGPGGTGVGKRWEQGALDVAGDIYIRGRRIPIVASGQLTITPTAADTATSAAVTLPTGLFGTAPDVISGVSSPNARVGTSGVTATGFTVTIIRNTTTNTVVTWRAVLS